MSTCFRGNFNVSSLFCHSLTLRDSRCSSLCSVHGRFENPSYLVLILILALIWNIRSPFQFSKCRNSRVKTINFAAIDPITMALGLNNYFPVNMSDSKKVWKGIGQLVNLKSRSGSAPTKLLVEDAEFNDPKSMDVAFNNFFANIGNNLTKNIPRVNKFLLQYLTSPSQDSFFIFPTRAVEIENEIIGLMNEESKLICIS